MELAFFAIGARVGAIASLDDTTFDRMRDADRTARQSQAMRQESRAINFRTGHGRRSLRRPEAELL